MRIAIGLAAMVLLAGCYGRAPEADRQATEVNGSADENAKAPVVQAGLVLAGDGVAIDGKRTGFGAARDEALAAVEAALGKPLRQSTNPECGEGPADSIAFANGFTLFVQDGKFAGWTVDGRQPNDYRTANGLRTGMTLQKMRDAGDVAVQSAAFGTEFNAGDISGGLTADAPGATVTDLRAGVNCALR